MRRATPFLVLDFGILAQNFNTTGNTLEKGDFNGDGIVNALDFSALASGFGGGVSNAAAMNTY